MDIKPDNFLVKADNTIKLGDFGLAVDLNDQEHRSNPLNLEESKRTPTHDTKVNYLLFVSFIDFYCQSNVTF